MLLSRFWYGALALGFGAAVFILFVAVRLYNRGGNRAMAESLSSDSSAVEWYLKDDARKRSSALIPIVLNADVRSSLSKASGDATVPRDIREKARLALRKLTDEVPADLKFDVLWAVDNSGRVIGASGFEHSEEDWDLGGYPVVADALHGWIRDDAWVWKGRIYRVVARPVEQEVNGEPVGAIVGAKIVDDNFARAVTKRTGSAVGFYAEGARVASGAPEGFDKANLDLITQDLKLLEDNRDYQDKGRSEVRVIGEHLGVVYARMPGEAWDLGAGYAVGRLAVAVESPMDFLNKADNTDKENVPTILIILGILGVAAIGLVLSVLEHTMPLNTFRTEVARLANGEIDVFQPSRFRGIYKKIAADLNDGMEKVASKGGVPRKAADLEQVLGPIPTQPKMSAFSVPGPGEDTSPSQPRLQKPLPRASKRSGETSGISRSPGADSAVSDPFGQEITLPKAPPVAPKRPSSAPMFSSSPDLSVRETAAPDFSDSREAAAPPPAAVAMPSPPAAPVASAAKDESEMDPFGDTPVPDPAPVPPPAPASGRGAPPPLPPPSVRTPVAAAAPAAPAAKPAAPAPATRPAAPTPAARPSTPAPAAKPAAAAPAARPAAPAPAAKAAPPPPMAAEMQVTEGSISMLSPLASTTDELSEWQKIYEEFLAVKKQCAEPTAGLTFDKFKGTLQRNKDALISKHAGTRVKFTVYVKDGKAALKASPVK